LAAEWQRLTLTGILMPGCCEMADSELPKAAETSGGAQEPTPVQKNEFAKETFWRWIIGGSFAVLLISFGLSFAAQDAGHRMWCQNTCTTIIGALIGFISGFYSKSKGGQ
jgi:hypothetical protein